DQHVCVHLQAFCDALVVKNVNNNDDFFTMGGDSISAAHTCHKLGINMKLLYTFPTPLKLATALLDPKIRVPTRLDMEVFVGGPQLSKDTEKTNKPHGRLSSKLGKPDAENHPNKVFKLDGDRNADKITSFAASRCNKVMFGENYNVSK
ncbi:MAG: acyl carrier protein, partial [Candidatus Phytoplasma australasiaticum]|nr:acyl carrier protein [Candidatus Phytoplasma australasiaticum]